MQCQNIEHSGNMSIVSYYTVTLLSFLGIMSIVCLVVLVNMRNKMCEIFENIPHIEGMATRFAHLKGPRGPLKGSRGPFKRTPGSI